MKSVKVVFDNGMKEYSYGCLDDSVQIGDYYIVLAPGDRPAVVKVVSISDKISDVITKTLLIKQNVDYLKTVDESGTQRVKTYRDIKSRLDAKLNKFKEQSVYELLATQDPEAARLLKELKSFN